MPYQIYFPMDSIRAVGLSLGLTNCLYQRDKDYCIGVVSSRWPAKGANVDGAGLRLEVEVANGKLSRLYRFLCLDPLAAQFAQLLPATRAARRH